MITLRKRKTKRAKRVYVFILRVISYKRSVSVNGYVVYARSKYRRDTLMNNVKKSITNGFLELSDYKHVT